MHRNNLPESDYHTNWNVRAKRVECPENLTRVTGCKLNNQGLPKANPAAQNAATADSSFKTGYHTTTMQDCCRPTCAYPGNVSNADARGRCSTRATNRATRSRSANLTERDPETAKAPTDAKDF